MQFRKLFTKENVLTIPNLLSLIRLAIIPFICIAYFYGKYFAAAGLIVLSALTDIADGIGLMAARVSICAGHQANMVIRLLQGLEEV